MSKKEKTIVELGKEDGALIVRSKENGFELVIPKLIENDDTTVPEDIYRLIIIAILFGEKHDDDDELNDLRLKLKSIINETIELMKKE